MKKCIVIWLLSAALVSGCATKDPTISIEEAKKYTGLDVSGFLNHRYGQYKRLAQKVEFTYRYRAFFDENDISILLRPSTELQNFCVAQGGRVLRSQPYSGDPIGKYFTSSLVHKRYAHIPGQSGSITGAAAVLDMAHNMRRPSLITYIDRQRYRNAYAAAVEKGAFGTWECWDRLGTRRWSASVLPIAYMSETVIPGSTLPGSILIEITPLQQQEAPAR